MIPFFSIKEQLLKEKISVGLDIGSAEVKMVKLRFLKDEIQLCAFSAEPAQLDLEHVIKNMAKPLEASKVNISFAGPATILRYPSFMRMNEQELKQALKFESQKHIPFPIPEVHLDGYILKADLPDNKMLIVLAAVKKESMKQKLALIGNAGLKVNVADIDSLALINGFNHNYAQNEQVRNKTVALLNVGASLSNLNILENTIPRFSRDIALAGKSFTQRLADVLGIDFKAAEECKFDPEKLKQEKAIAAVDSIISNLASEIRISFDYYESQSSSSVERIFISGGGAFFKRLPEVLSHLLGVDVSYWDPFKHVTLQEGLDRKKAEATSGQFAVALGLALRG